MKLLIPIALLLSPVSYSAPLTLDELRTCMARDEALAQRRDLFDGEARAIAREGADLDRELAALDPRDAAAVAAYNARSAAHNRRVEAQNRRAAQLNGDNARLDAMCARPFYPEDRDLILRGTIR